MDSQNNLNQNPDQSQPQTPPMPQQPISAPVPPSAPAVPAAKKSRKWLILGGITVGIVIVAALFWYAFQMGKMSAVTDLSSNIQAGDTPTTETEEIPEVEDKTEEIDTYLGWQTYESAAYGYSFKYPSDWSFDRQVYQEPTDWVTVNPPSGKGKYGSSAVSIYTYFDGTGCPNTKTKEFSIGGYTVEGTACAETEQYRFGMQHSKTVGATNGVVLVRTADNGVGILIDLDLDDGKTIQMILDSITGLTPAK